MELFIPEGIKNKMMIAEGKGLIAGERFYDILYVRDVIGGINYAEHADRIAQKYPYQIIGEYVHQRSSKTIQMRKLFKEELQWIKLVIVKKQMKAYIRLLDNNQTKAVIKPVKILIV